MDFGDAQFLPVAPPFFFLLAGVVAILLILVQLRLLQYAYTQLGVSSQTAVLLLIASLLGSYVNVPIAMLGGGGFVSEREIVYYGVPYVVPRLSGSQTILAVNIGGAVIPTLLSCFLLSRNALWGRGLVAAFGVAAVSHAYAEPVRGIGIALPIFVGPLAATIIAAIVSWRNLAPLAYAGGSLGVLIGADLMNLDKLGRIGTPMLSIGGAGTFDGIFMTGVLSVLLASLIGGRTQNAESYGAP
ncbi:DUF1614 domain-containing protein [Methylocystis parvus]|uniref:DUF1614 domain-containing protein n=1 Tax=Methylocystis parvus TaxID=134 RepID=A0A6B8M1L6_9HYPH|nr:DUF1614 domain-containing protein [Methylocystis parvus]QGM96185.1 DUF1614 domain-containing protein [Methylocystis parvus]WBJ99989.1 DUF1614 domain-containing protein [Methylocystis parvus OBBP]